VGIKVLDKMAWWNFKNKELMREQRVYNLTLLTH